MNEHLSIDGQQRYEAILKQHQVKRLTTMEAHPRLRTPRSMVAPLHRMYVSKSTRRLIRNVVIVVIGAVALAWMCVP